jgi:uncharacterized protein DUF6448
MMNKTIIAPSIVSIIFSSIVLFLPGQAMAHCDGFDGPVIKAAQKALETGDVNLVLIWVQKTDQSEISEAFNKTVAVRKLSQQAKELADRYFFETLVRVHRSGEGAPYTGLKPAGRDLGPAIPAGDQALENGKVEPLVKLLTDEMQAGLREKFKQTIAKKQFAKDDVAAGQEYVKNYVEFIHCVERIYEAAENPAAGHYPEPQGTAHEQ